MTHEMEGNSVQQFVESQPMLINSNHQMLINEPECVVNTEELTVVQEVQKECVQHQTTFQDIPISGETFNSNEEELHDLQLSKLREHNAIYLNHLLRIEIELLAKSKAKAEVKVHIMQSQIQEEQASRGVLGQEIANLNGIEEELQQKMNFEIFQRAQIEKEMSTTGEIITILKQSYEKTQKNYESMLQNVQELQRKYEENHENYEAKKQQISESIQNESKKFEELRNYFQNDCTQYETEINEKNDIVKELNETYTKFNDEIASVTANCEILKNQIDMNENSLKELLSRNDNLRNSTNNINLQELEEEKIQGEQLNKVTLDLVKNQLEHTRQSFNNLEQQEIDLQKHLVQDTNITNELHTALSKSEDAFEQLLITHQLLENTIDEVNTQATTVYNELKLKTQEIDRILTELKEKISQTVCDKDAKINELHIIQKHNEETQAKLNDMQFLEESLKKEIDSNATEVAHFQQQKTDAENNIEQLIPSIKDAKEIFFQRKETSTKQLSELNKDLFDTQTELKKLKHEHENKIKNLNDELSDYKIQTEKADQENQQNIKQKLQKLEERLTDMRSNNQQAKEHLNHTEALIDMKKLVRDGLEADRQKIATSSRPLLVGDNSSQKSASEPISTSKPASILKSSGKSTSPGKKVSFYKEPIVWPISDSSVDTTVDAGNINQQRKPDKDKFDELLRTSPPQRLYENNPRKRSRLDSP